MKGFDSRNPIRIVLMTLILLMGVSLEVQGQGRGRRVMSGLDRKCAKFVNCHDARDGRWDGRGPRTGVVFGAPTWGRSRRVGAVVDAIIRIGRYPDWDDRYGRGRARGR